MASLIYTIDENYFLFFETFDFVHKLKLNGKKLYTIKKIKFKHLGASSLPKKFDNLVKKTRSFHYNWSKFYYFKKHYNYFYALKKTFPNLRRALISYFLNLILLTNIRKKFLKVKLFFNPRTEKREFYKRESSRLKQEDFL